jgi:S1-C subfamily serine protease
MKCPLRVVLSLCLAQLLGPLGQRVEAGQLQTASRPTETKAVPGQTTSNLSPSQIFSRSRSSVVVIVASSENEQGLGSGFIVGDGKIVTNHHVLLGMTEAFVVFADGKVQPVLEVIAASAEQDLMIVKVQTGRRPPLSLGDELSLNEGDPVYAIGAPKGLELSFTNGIVSSFRKSSSQFLIQTTAPIAPGSSGGPLLDKSGFVVGVTTSRITDAPGIYFSVGSGDVKRLIRTPYAVTLNLADWAKQYTKTTDFGGAAPGHPQDSSEGGPALGETLAWMLDFAKRHYRVTGNYANRYSDSFEVDQGCDARISHFMQSSPSSPVGSIDTFRLRDIDPAHISVSDPANVNLFTIRNQTLIHRGGTQSVSSSDLYMDYISFDSRENAERFATALKHAVTLCSSAKEPF